LGPKVFGQNILAQKLFEYIIFLFILAKIFWPKIFG
jgi:hypothetical protein